MSYTASGQVGSYYTFNRGQMMSGLGACGCGGASGCGCSGCGCSGFGDITFNGDTAWSLWVQCAKLDAQGMTGSPQCKEAADSIRAGLMELGYGVLPRGNIWASADVGAWKQFTSQHGLPTGGGIPTKGGLQLMDALLQEGKHPGPEPPIEMTKVGDEYVEAKAIEDRAGLGTYLLLGVLGVAVAGGAYYFYDKKKKGRR